ncbi:MAG TPA: hypothetical protein VLU54_08150 [Casimicrobiaceae bacterium]|nr:hypothetical protein [Casimicrobiaceae bacterium]
MPDREKATLTEFKQKKSLMNSITCDGHPAGSAAPNDLTAADLLPIGDKSMTAIALTFVLDEIRLARRMSNGIAGRFAGSLDGR